MKDAQSQMTEPTPQVTRDLSGESVWLTVPTETKPGTVALAGRVRFWWPKGLDYDVAVTLGITGGALDEAGHVVDELTLIRRADGPPVTVRAVQRAALGSFIREARIYLSSQGVLQADGQVFYSSRGAFPGHVPAPGGFEQKPGDQEVLDRSSRPRGGRRAVKTEQRLRQVAEVYREAVEKDERAPARVLAELGETLKIVSTGPKGENRARWWIRQAREAGLIPPSGNGTRPNISDYDGWEPKR